MFSLLSASVVLSVPGEPEKDCGGGGCPNDGVRRLGQARSESRICTIVQTIPPRDPWTDPAQPIYSFEERRVPQGIDLTSSHYLQPETEERE